MVPVLTVTSYLHWLFKLHTYFFWWGSLKSGKGSSALHLSVTSYLPCGHMILEAKLKGIYREVWFKSFLHRLKPRTYNNYLKLRTCSSTLISSEQIILMLILCMIIEISYLNFFLIKHFFDRFLKPWRILFNGPL